MSTIKVPEKAIPRLASLVAAKERAENALKEFVNGLCIGMGFEVRNARLDLEKMELRLEEPEGEDGNDEG